MPEGGRLRLRVQQCTDAKSQVRGFSISVCDNGSGIKPEDARRLFEPFFSTKAAKGTGLGLWISKGIIQKYEGTIQFRSVRTAKGCATCFRVFLPEQVAAKLAKASAASGERMARSNGGSLA
jgi:signal transduction histidine kinase